MLFDYFTASTTDPSKNSIKDASASSTDASSSLFSLDWLFGETPSISYLIDRAKHFYEHYPTYTMIIFVAHIVVCIIAAMLALECNQYESPALQIFVVIIAFLFGEVYIVYYAIYHIVVGVRCYNPPVYGNIARYSAIAAPQ